MNKPTLLGALKEAQLLSPSERLNLQTFVGRTLKHLILEDLDFSFIDFSKCRFTNVKFKNCTFEHTCFDNCNLAQVNFVESPSFKISAISATLYECTFDSCRAVHVHLTNAHIEDCMFIKLMNPYISFLDAKISKTKFQQMYTPGLRFVGATLTHCMFGDVNMQRCDFDHANLIDCRFNRVNFYEVDFVSTKLKNVYVDFSSAFFHLQCPEKGAFIAWKKLASGCIAKLEIPASAKRSSATTLKCRASKAKVLAIYNDKGRKILQGKSAYDDDFVYNVGATVTPKDPFDLNRWKECTSGIHFFLTRQLAEEY